MWDKHNGILLLEATFSQLKLGCSNGDAEAETNNSNNAIADTRQVVITLKSQMFMMLSMSTFIFSVLTNRGAHEGPLSN